MAKKMATIMSKFFKIRILEGFSKSKIFLLLITKIKILKVFLKQTKNKKVKNTQLFKEYPTKKKPRNN